MSGGGGGGGNAWKYLFGIGAVVAITAMALEPHYGHSGIGIPVMLVVGGLMLLFGSCEALILSVDGLGGRLKWNPFFAGTMAGLASNLPEIIMIGFVVAKNPRVAFVVTCLTLHVNALVFGLYTALLPKDESGHARMPKAIVEIGTDLVACAAGLFLALGSLMVTMKLFATGKHSGEGLGMLDLTVIGGALLVVLVVSIVEMARRFSQEEAGERPENDTPEPPASWGRILGFGLLGTVGSMIGGDAVGEFAEALVHGLQTQGWSEMIGAIIISLFSGIASYLLLASAHVKKKYDVALSTVTGAVTEMPFLVLPATFLMMAGFARFGIIPRLPNGAVLAIDLETTSVLLFGFPTLLVLWKSIADDGKISPMETAVMVVLFGLVIYFLAAHG
jgi:hypothetical protein